MTCVCKPLQRGHDAKLTALAVILPFPCCRASNAECPTFLSHSVWNPILQGSGCDQMRYSLQCIGRPISQTTSKFQVKRDGPRAASKRVREENSTPQQMESWLKKAVADSLLGSCPKSHRRFLSGLAAWQDFARRNLGIADKKQLPPSLNGLLAWSRTFL